jgi:Phd_YefM.
MFKVGADSQVTTISDLRKDTKKTLAASREAPVYVLKDGKPVAALVSIELLEMVNEARENRRLAQIAARRLDAIGSGEDELMDEAAFWAAVKKRRPTARKR